MDEALDARIRSLVSALTGVKIRGQDHELLRRVIASRASDLHLSPEHYMRLLQEESAASRDERRALIVLLTTGETFFFRDKGQFALLADTILPDLIERRRAQRALRLWSAGCSTGEEAYSLAMALDRLLPDRPDWDLLVLGTDINPKAIAQAREGLYGSWAFRSVEAEVQTRHFRRTDNTWVLNQRIRDLVTFRVGDLILDEFPSPTTDLHDMDLILCRNVFIYLTPESVNKVLAKLTRTLAEGGYLMTAHAEVYARHLTGLKTMVYPDSILYQRSTGPPAAGAALGAPAASPSRPAPVPRDQPAAARPADQRPTDQPDARGRSLIEEAWELANRGDHEQAVRVCREALAANPLDAEPYYLLAQIAEEQGQAGVAKDWLKKVLYLAPQSVAAYVELGALYERDGDPAQARKMWAAAAELLKDVPVQDKIAPYRDSTAGELLVYLRRLLEAEEA